VCDAPKQACGKAVQLERPELRNGAPAPNRRQRAGVAMAKWPAARANDVGVINEVGVIFVVDMAKFPSVQ
jgi:hypothetical protein